MDRRRRSEIHGQEIASAKSADERAAGSLDLVRHDDTELSAAARSNVVNDALDEILRGRGERLVFF